MMFLGSCVSQTEAKKDVDFPAKPNVIFIIVDDQSTDLLGFMEGKALTPHIDRLAQDGIRFERAYVADSVCSPSRYTCLSGQYASRCTLSQFNKAKTTEGVTRVLWNIGFSNDQITPPTTGTN